MDDGMSETINNICTILGGALLLYPLIDKATKTIIPEVQKLTAGESEKFSKLLPQSKEHEESSEKEHEQFPDKQE